MASETTYVDIKNLTKKFGSKTALDDVDLVVPPGGIIGLLGSNGAGKSTLLRHMIGLYLPTSGQCATFGTSCTSLSEKELSRIGYVHQEGELVNWMKVKQFIRFISSYYSTWSADLEKKLIEQFEIDRDQRIGAMSPGQRQRLALLAGVCFEPDLLILDEPAAGLDPEARVKLIEFLLNLIQDPNRTIVISSHILSDVEKLVDRVVIMKNGRIKRDCSLDEIREDYSQLRLQALDPSYTPALTVPGAIKQNFHAGQGMVVVRARDLKRAKEEASASGYHVSEGPVTLEEIYQFEIGA